LLFNFELLSTCDFHCAEELTFQIVDWWIFKQTCKDQVTSQSPANLEVFHHHLPRLRPSMHQLPWSWQWIPHKTHILENLALIFIKHESYTVPPGGSPECRVFLRRQLDVVVTCKPWESCYPGESSKKEHSCNWQTINSVFF